MTRVLVVACSVVAVACSNAVDSVGPLMPPQGDAKGVQGLERLERTGAFESGVEEQFRLHVDSSIVSRVEWSASGGALSTSGNAATWKMPRTATASLELAVHRRDGSIGNLVWTFSVLPTVDSSRPRSAQAALLTTPMPVLDGGSIEVSGGACEVRYEGTTSNVAIAFTTATHPALMYGRWNGSVWTLEVVDAMGFNTGGAISQFVSMQVEAAGTPHLTYVRDNQVWYATKSGGTWLRERVDSVAQPYAAVGIVSSSRAETSAPSIVLAATTPSVLYASGTSPYRPVIAVRTAANSWTRNVIPGAAATTSNVYPMGELVIDAAGRYVFTAEDFTSVSPFTKLMGWTSTGGGQAVAQPFDSRGDAVLVGGTRLLTRSLNGVFDFSLNSTFSATTATWSSVEVSGSLVGDLEWNPVTSRPVLLHHHGSVLELVTPNASGFWTYTQLGTSSGVSAGLAVHPTSGEASICYQANSRIMFQ